MKYKSEVARIFWRFKKKVENQSSCRIQAIRSNNGKEYTSLKLNLYCEDAGIEHQLIAPYAPKHNGVSERRNIYIIEMVRCMLHEKNLPKTFWAKAANTTIFLQNRLSTKLLEEKTLFEVWYNYKPSLSFLKIFGSVLFMFHKSRGTSLTRRLCRVSLLAIVPFLKPTKYIIIKLRRWPLPGMFISIKKNNGTGETHKEMSCWKIKSNFNSRMNQLMIHQSEAPDLLKTFTKGVM
jgi:hypothetical protein